MRILSIAGVLIALGLAAAVVVGSRPEPVKPPPRPNATAPLRATLAIAPADEALTFARFADGPGFKTLAVQTYKDGVVGGVDLSPLMENGEDAIGLYNRLGYDAVAAFVASAAATASRDAAALATPVDLRKVHAAVATNYPEHADEANVEDGPFMFAKIAQPTASRAAIPATDGLLDYEVELCLVTLTPIAATGGAKGGLILCNDVTDRAALLRGADVRDMMAEVVDKRFGATRCPHRVEWHTDNGPIYTANETRAFGASCGFVVTTTPAYSPESNGMAEALVKTMKRDYFYVADFDDIADAATVLRRLPGWFNDYNEHAPHRALGMLSPREFRRREAA